MQNTLGNDQSGIGVLSASAPAMTPTSAAGDPLIILKQYQHTIVGWLMIGLLLLVQWILFNQFAQREIIWAYPTSYDQNSYLSQSYEIYEQILNHGLWNGLEYGLSQRIPTGLMLRLQANLLFLLFGASRLSALTLNFVYFALFQGILAGTLRWLSGRWSIGLLGIGLLLTTTSPFFWAGGLMDFRIDFITFCLFGILICAVIRSGFFTSWRWSLVVGAIAALLVLFRFLTMIYLVGIFGLVLLFFASRIWRFRNDTSAHQAATHQLAGLIWAIGLLLCLTLPVLWYHRQGIQAYYVVGHVTGSESQIRAAEAGVNNFSDYLFYYLKSIWQDHLGSTFLGLSLLLSLIALCIRYSGYAVRRVPTLVFDVYAALFFFGCCFLVPYSILTLNVAKSPVVGNILVSPLLWLVLLLIILLTRAQRTNDTQPAFEYLLSILAAIALITGMFTQLNRFSTHTNLSLHREDVTQVLSMYDTVGNYSRLFGWKDLRVSSDSVVDYLFPSVIKPLVYERQGQLLNVQAQLGGSIFAVTEAQALDQLQRSDVVILSNSSAGETMVYPFNQVIQQLRPRLRAFCEESFVSLGQFHFFGRIVTLYVRPSAVLIGDSGGWITSDGIIINSMSSMIQKRPVLELQGTTNFAWLPHIPKISATLQVPGHRPITVPATLTATGNAYRIQVDTHMQDIPDQGEVQIQLTFDTYFVPKAIGLNEDTRQLVISTPSEINLLRSKE